MRTQVCDVRKLDQESGINHRPAAASASPLANSSDGFTTLKDGILVLTGVDDGDDADGASRRVAGDAAEPRNKDDCPSASAMSSHAMIVAATLIPATTA
jgi:hypothetical protein